MGDTRVDVLEMREFLDDGARAELVEELGRAHGAAATVTGGRSAGAAVEHAVRRTTKVQVPDETRARVKARLMESKPALEAHFGVALSECEAPQFLRYEEGDFFVAHQDGNTSVIHDDTRHRRVSAVVFLSPRTDEPTPGAYGGGELTFHGPYPRVNDRIPAPCDPGTLVAFRSETTHEVTPVAHGVRYTIVTWFR
ncbi:MAG: hypothetical protein JWM27_3219 [Gemmatimonadetes bacterium]|nr:hypothetical protein [Gemmatimonadota bacterium]